MTPRILTNGDGRSGIGIALRSGRGHDRGSSRLSPAMVFCALLSIVGLSRVEAGDSGRVADELLRLVPADATVVVTVEGLRDQFRTLAASRLASNLRQLPAVRAWFESEPYRNLERSRVDIESGLGVKLADLRDDLVGDAAVLVLRLDPDALPDPRQARGMLMLRARDPELLDRVIARVNASQQGSGELERVRDRVRGATAYHVREFPGGAGRPPEWYVRYPDGTFAFSNSEALIHGVIDRKARTTAGKDGADEGAPAGAGLGELPKFKALRRRLPEQALARVFVDPRSIERLLVAVPRSNKPSDVRILAMLERYLAAVDYAGAVLTLGSDAIVVYAVETINPSRLEPWLRRWSGDSRAWSSSLRRVPATALALASAHVDASALREAVFQLIPSDSQQRVSNLESLATGLLLGQDLGSRILPALGPGVIAYIDSPHDPKTKADGSGPTPGRGSLFPVVVVVGFSQEPGTPRSDGRSPESRTATIALASALDNALRTVLTMTALGESHGEGRSRIVTRDVAGSTVTTLDVPLPFAYAVDRARGRLVLGTSAVAVTRYLECSSDPEAGHRFRELQALAFPDAETFLCVDLDALSGLVDRYRDRVVRNIAARQKRPTADVERDLDHVVALARLFRAAFISSRMEPDATAIHRSIGVILHQEDATARRSP
ncbi:MAG: hypothetical protein ACLQGP_13370 [Isosphaeraceae bacterium]